jgi:hypothetical protein
MLSATGKVQEFDCPTRGRSQLSFVANLRQNREQLMTIQAGDKVVRHTATQDAGAVRLGDAAPVFTRPVRAGDKVVRDASTQNSGNVRLGDAAPVFTR